MEWILYVALALLALVVVVLSFALNSLLGGAAELIKTFVPQRGDE